MTDAAPRSPDPVADERSLLWLGAGQGLLWIGFAVLSWRFDPGGDVHQRPLLPVLGLLALLFTLYAASAHVLWRRRDDTAAEARLLRQVWLFAIVFRVLMIFTVPVQEVDYFRYLWDGRQVLAGVSPYAFSPAQVDEALAGAAEAQSTAMQRLTAQVRRSGTTREIFQQVDHRSVPSIYPPAAQAVFALVAAVTPERAPRWAHLTILRLGLLAFDLLVIGMLVGMLRRVGMNPALALVYAWSPLVLKEFANSAHMDVIAVALLMGAMRLCMEAVPAREAVGRRAVWFATGGAALWGAAVLAKFFPLVLAPLFWRWWGRSHSIAMRLMLVGTAALVIAGGYALMPRAAASAGNVSSHGTFSALGAFAKGWEMNDLIFAVIHENLRGETDEAVPAGGANVSTGPWFAITPWSWRKFVTRFFQAAVGVAGPKMESERVSFLMAQVIIGILVAGVAFRLAWRPWPEDADLAAGDLLRRAFGTLAALWYLSATQNPWYWAWALPFVPFARCARVWLWTGGLALLYYLRFWLRYHGHVLPPGWDGLRIFDEGIVWLEHLPVLLLVWWFSMRADKGDGNRDCC